MTVIPATKNLITTAGFAITDAYPSDWIGSGLIGAGLRRGRAVFRRSGMKPLLNVIREFNEIDLGNSRFGFKHNPIPLHTGHSGVPVFLAIKCFEVLSQRECR